MKAKEKVLILILIRWISFINEYFYVLSICKWFRYIVFVSKIILFERIKILLKKAACSCWLRVVMFHLFEPSMANSLVEEKYFPQYLTITKAFTFFDLIWNSINKFKFVNFRSLIYCGSSTLVGGVSGFKAMKLCYVIKGQLHFDTSMEITIFSHKQFHLDTGLNHSSFRGSCINEFWQYVKWRKWKSLCEMIKA